MATINDVAKKAGVSKTTVSRFLNGQYNYMSEATRARILEAVKELDYRPNLIAASLKTKRTYTIGLLVPDISNHFWAGVIQAISTTASKFGYSLILSSIADDSEAESKYLRILKDRQVDGLIVAPSGRNIGVYRELLAEETPIVFIDRYIPSLPIDAVGLDNAKAIYEAMYYLKQLGHRRIALLTGPVQYHVGRAERVSAFQRCVEDFHFHQEECPVLAQLATMEGGYNATLEALSMRPRPTAVLSAHNPMTLGALKAIHTKGLIPPQDLSVVGFDDIDWAVAIRPAITTVAQPIASIGSQAVRRLLWIVDEGLVPKGEIVRLEPSLIVRGSSGPPPAEID